MQEGVGLLPLLRDIHEPATPGWWPPAVGWWVLAVLVIVLIYAVTLTLLKRYKAKAAYREAMKSIGLIQLGSQSQFEKLTELNSLLKRAALTKTSEESVAALHGKNWIGFLQNTSGKQKFSEEVLKILAFTQYQPPSAFTPVSAQDFETVFETSKYWLKHNL